MVSSRAGAGSSARPRRWRGALLAGCGRDEARERAAADAEVLGGLLRRELAAGARVAGLAGAAAIARQDELHAERLAALAGAGAAAAGCRSRRGDLRAGAGAQAGGAVRLRRGAAAARATPTIACS